MHKMLEKLLNQKHCQHNTKSEDTHSKWNEKWDEQRTKKKKPENRIGIETEGEIDSQATIALRGKR